MLVMTDEKNEAPELEERGLTAADIESIDLAIRVKRPLGWVHVMALVRRNVELEVENSRLAGIVGEGCGHDRQAGKVPGQRQED
jgi:hypothetical protein